MGPKVTTFAPYTKLETSVKYFEETPFSYSNHFSGVGRHCFATHCSY